MKAIVESQPVGLLQCNCTVIGDPATGEAIVVDPGDEPAVVLALLEAHGLRCVAIVNTHAHIDHVGANAEVREATGARLLMHAADVPLYGMLEEQSRWLGGMIPVPRHVPVDEELRDGARLAAGGIGVDVLHTPGHTPGSTSFHAAGLGLVCTGDTLFAGGIGRTDLWGGDHEQEIDSIRRRLLALDDGVRVIPGHGPATTIGRERRANPFLTGRA
jgi:glyoxylase-like metal-dependent hydrolase (beta-lactamase superfamily II)